MAPEPKLGAGEPPVFERRPLPETDSWSLLDKIGLGLAWAAGIALCLIAASIVFFMMFKGLQYLSLDMLVDHPQPSLDQSKSGGFFDPLIGTLILTVMAIVIAAPAGICIAVWLTEYGRPKGLARLVESGIEIVAGTPSIVLAIFGLLVFQQTAFGFLSFTAAGGAVFGRSFIIAAIMMSLIALPLVVGSVREALNSIPAHVREASYALGKDRAWTIRKVLLPASRSGIATGMSLGMGRVAGDTAIVVILLGASLELQKQGNVPILSTLTGTGSTLTTYVFNNSPAGEGNSANKAYAAAFVLLLIVIAFNFAVDLITRRKDTSTWNR